MTKQKNFRFKNDTEKKLIAITKFKNELVKATLQDLGEETIDISQTTVLVSLIEKEYARLKKEGYEID